MFYTIYKTTNKITGKIYIGKHQTNDLKDGYIGSGKRLWNSINKYGIENFEKEILFVFETEAEMNAKEKELVTEEFCLREDTYNLCPGGKGGWGYINSNLTDELREIRKSNARNIPLERKIYSGKKTGSVNLKQAHIEGKIKYNTLLGKKHSTETKRKIGEKISILQKGEGNSQFNTIWISDGTQSKKIRKDDTIPEGWHKGRK